jgi:hypothetical protein
VPVYVAGAIFVHCVLQEALLCSNFIQTISSAATAASRKLGEQKQTARRAKCFNSAELKFQLCRAIFIPPRSTSWRFFEINVYSAEVLSTTQSNSITIVSVMILTRIYIYGAEHISAEVFSQRCMILLRAQLHPRRTSKEGNNYLLGVKELV